jgi:hypothetical protein
LKKTACDVVKSVSDTVKLKFPVAVGVPDNRPDGLSESPVGSAPLDTASE